LQIVNPAPRVWKLYRGDTYVGGDGPDGFAEAMVDDPTSIGDLERSERRERQSITIGLIGLAAAAGILVTGVATSNVPTELGGFGVGLAGFGTALAVAFAGDRAWGDAVAGYNERHASTCRN
jgi:hypothetical protein